ncbi:MAG: nucleotidyl transferase AbiEii/AbiGii toxin family protein [Planctomycetota bacterium]
MAGESILEAIRVAAACLDRAGHAYALIGGAALPAWGRIRATEDADVLVHLSSGADWIPAIVSALREAGFAHLDRADRRALGTMTVLSFWYPVRPHGFSVRLDVLVVEGPEYREVLDRAAVRRIDDLEVRVASCEDLVVLKLVSARPVDLADVRDLIAINREALDWEYLRSRAARAGVSAQLDAAAAECARD